MNSYLKFKLSAAVIGINHLIGVVGLNIAATQSLFEQVSWINLFITFLLLVWNHEPKNREGLFFIAAAFTIGMVVEIAGVKTGVIFGEYHYTPTLGLSVAGVPLIIGFNWVLLSYCCAGVAERYITSVTGRVVAASLLMVITDLLLETFAIRHGLWVWTDAHPPFQNFAAWFVTSLPIQWLFVKWVKSAQEDMSVFYLVVLYAFLTVDKLLA